MTPEEFHRFKLQMVNAEDSRAFPYDDATGKPCGHNVTVGIGRNLSGKGLSPDEIEYLFANDVKEIEHQATTTFADWYPELSPVRQRVVLDMLFNLGLRKFLKFSRTISALARKDFQAASEGVLNSNLSPRRKQRLAQMLVLDKDITS